MVRPKDPLWEHVEQSENSSFLCIYCGHKFAGSISITRIKYHLSGIRKRDTEICPEVPEDVQEKAYQAIAASNKKAKSMASLNDVEENETIPPSLPSSSKGLRQSITSTVCRKDKSEVDEKLAKFILSSNIELFDVIKRPFFVDFLKSIAEFGPSYKLPKFSTLKDQILPKIQEEVDKYIENIKESMLSTGYTVMFELRGRELIYLNIFVYTPVGAMLVGSVNLKESSYNPLEEQVCSMVNSFSHRYVVQSIIANDALGYIGCPFGGSDGDKAESSKLFRDMLSKMFPLALVTGCVAEEIQLLLKAICERVPWVWNTFYLAYVIVKYLYKHGTDLSLGQEKLRSKNYGCKFFNGITSKFLMLTSILKIKSDLQALPLSRASPSCELEDQELAKEAAKAVDFVIHSEDFWTRGKELVQLLEPLFRVLRLVDGNGPTSGYLYEAMRRAENVIKQNCGSNPVDYSDIWDIFKSKRSCIIHPIHAAAAFLNPAYMVRQNFTADNEMEEGINYISKYLIPAESKESFMNQVELYRKKKLFMATSMRMLETCHPGIWWKNYGGHLFVLKAYASQILSQPCSSSLCKLNYLEPEKIDHDHKFRINLMMMEKFSMLGKQELEPIDLDKIPGLPEYAPENSTTEFDDMFEIGLSRTIVIY